MSISDMCNDDYDDGWMAGRDSLESKVEELEARLFERAIDKDNYEERIGGLEAENAKLKKTLKETEALLQQELDERYGGE